MDNNELKCIVRSKITALSTELKALALRLWEHPELSGQEYFASAELCRFISEHAVPVEPGFKDYPTAFRTEVGTGSPCFAIAAEYDALPGVGHGCGHNLIAAAGIGAFCAAAKILKDHNLPGKLAMLGTPAEEYGGGKVKLLRQGILDGVDAVMMTHPSWHTRQDSGSTAIRHYDVTFHGVAAHAAASPELGKNALDAVMLLFAAVNAFRQQMPQCCLIHGVVTNGGEKPNIIPEAASCQFFLRSSKEAWMDRLDKRFADMVRGAALMTDTTFTVEKSDEDYRGRKPNPSLNRSFLEMMPSVAPGPFPPGRGSSDFGDFSRVVPGAHPYFGITDHRIASHSVEFAEAARSEMGFDSMLHAAEALAYTACRYLCDEPFRAQVKADFDNSED